MEATVSEATHGGGMGRRADRQVASERDRHARDRPPLRVMDLGAERREAPTADGTYPERLAPGVAVLAPLIPLVSTGACVPGGSSLDHGLQAVGLPEA